MKTIRLLALALPFFILAACSSDNGPSNPDAANGGKTGAGTGGVGGRAAAGGGAGRSELGGMAGLGAGGRAGGAGSGGQSGGAGSPGVGGGAGAGRAGSGGAAGGAGGAISPGSGGNASGGAGGRGGHGGAGGSTASGGGGGAGPGGSAGRGAAGSGGGGSGGMSASGGANGGSGVGAAGGGNGGAGSGGTGSGGASAGSGGSTVPTCLPKCLADLTVDCPATGSCQAQRLPVQPPLTDYLCWNDGTKAKNVTTSTPVQISSTISVLGAVVGKCYTLESVSAVPVTSVTYTWKGPDGTVAADGLANSATPNIVTIHCGGRTYMVDTSSPECQGKTLIPACTTAGSCSL